MILYLTCTLQWFFSWNCWELGLCATVLKHAQQNVFGVSHCSFTYTVRNRELIVCTVCKVRLLTSAPSQKICTPPCKHVRTAHGLSGSFLILRCFLIFFILCASASAATEWVVDAAHCGRNPSPCRSPTFRACFWIHLKTAGYVPSVLCEVIMIESCLSWRGS